MCGGWVGDVLGTQSPGEKARAAARDAEADARRKAKANLLAEERARDQAEQTARKDSLLARRRRNQNSLLATGGEGDPLLSTMGAPQAKARVLGG